MGTAIAAAVAAAGLSLSAGCTTSVAVDTPERQATLTVHNSSSYVISEIHLAGVGSSAWGPNLVPDAMLPGESVVFTEILCDDYDVLVVDETGVNCQLKNLSLCFEDQGWVIDDTTLDVCAFGKPQQQ